MVESLEWEVFGIDESVEFESIEDEINISRAFPNYVEEWVWGWITIRWKWFENIVSIQLSNNEIYESTDYEVVSDTSIVVYISPDLENWEYFFNLMWQSGIYEFPETTIEVR